MRGLLEPAISSHELATRERTISGQKELSRAALGVRKTLKIRHDLRVPFSLLKKPTRHWIEKLSALKIGDHFIVDFRQQQTVRRQVTRYSTGDMKRLGKYFYMNVLRKKRNGKKRYKVTRVSKDFKPARNAYVRRSRNYWYDIFEKMKHKGMIQIDETEVRNCTSALSRYAGLDGKFQNKTFRTNCIGEDDNGFLQYRIWRIK